MGHDIRPHVWNLVSQNGSLDVPHFILNNVKFSLLDITAPLVFKTFSIFGRMSVGILRSWENTFCQSTSFVW